MHGGSASIVHVCVAIGGVEHRARRSARGRGTCARRRRAASTPWARRTARTAPPSSEHSNVVPGSSAVNAERSRRAASVVGAAAPCRSSRSPGCRRSPRCARPASGRRPWRPWRARGSSCSPSARPVYVFGEAHAANAPRRRASTRTWRPPGRRRTRTSPPCSPSGSSGAESIVVSGAAIGPLVAGRRPVAVAGRVDRADLERVRRRRRGRCRPCGLVQAANAAPSRLHSNSSSACGVTASVPAKRERDRAARRR